MSEYIEREAAIALYEDDAVDMSVLKVPVPVIIQNLKDIPAADVVPKDFHERCLEIEIQKRIALERKMGHWIKSISVIGTTTGVTTTYTGYKCSVCGALMGRKDDAYCYKCGADMRGET